MAEEQPSFSNYPRYTPSAPGSEIRPPGIYFDIFRPAWNIVSQDLGTWIASVLIAGILGYGLLIVVSLVVTFGFMASAGQQATTSPEFIIFSQLANVIPTAVLFTFVASLVAMGVQQASGQMIQVIDVFAGFRRFGSFIALSAIYLLLATGLNLFFLAATNTPALLWLLIPLVLVLLIAAIWLYPSYTFIGPHLLMSGQNLGEAFSDVYLRMTPHALGFFALNLVLGLMLMGACFLCLVPVLFALPIYFMVLAMHYRFFFYQPSDIMSAPTRISEAPPQ